MTNIPSGSSSQSPQLHEELLFEYDQLRKEILQNDTLTMQIFGATVLLAGTIITITSSLQINLTLSGALIFVVWLVTVIALHQAVDRGRSSFVIASYLRLFVEEKLDGIKWETRLALFRGISRQHGYNSILTGQLWTYNLILVATFLVGSWCIIADLPYMKNILVALEAPGLFIWALFTIRLLWSAYRGYPTYGIKNVHLFDDVWKEAEKKLKGELSG